MSKPIIIALSILFTIPAHAAEKKETFYAAYSVACEVGSRGPEGMPLCRTFAGTTKTEGQCHAMLIAAARQLAATAVDPFEIVEVNCVRIEVSLPERAL